MRLFERRNGRLHPVPEAHYLHEECTELLHRMESIRNNMRGIKVLDRGMLNIVSMPGPSVVFLPSMIAKHLGKHNNARNTLISRSSEAVFELVAAQQYDLGLADYRQAAEHESSLLIQTIYSFECVCAIPGDGELAGRHRITPQDLSHKPFAMLYPEHPTHQATVSAFAQSRAELNCRFVTQYFIPLLTYVRQGLDNALVDPLTVEAYRLLYGDNDDVLFKTFKPVVRFSIVVLTPAHRPASLLAQSFQQYLHEELLRMGGRVID